MKNRIIMRNKKTNFKKIKESDVINIWVEEKRYWIVGVQVRNVIEEKLTWNRKRMGYIRLDCEINKERYWVYLEN